MTSTRTISTGTISTLLRVAWIRLRRDRGALFLTFILPIIFFSIFSMVFGQMGSGDGDLRKLEVLVLDLDRSELSQKLIRALAGQEALAIENASDETGSAMTREQLLALVRTGEADAALVLPEGLDVSFGGFGGESPEIELIFDAANPMAQHTLAGLLQASAMSAAPTTLIERGQSFLRDFGGGLTPEQEDAFAAVIPMIESSQNNSNGADGSGADGDGSGAGGVNGLVAVKATAAHDEGQEKERSLVPYYAAGTGVMFLLFSLAGAAGSLLDEQEAGTLERLLVSQVEMKALLASHWLFYSLVGIAQVVVMFLWGALVFDLELFTVRRLLGFALMAVLTATAASSFALVLATISRTRAQLNGLSTIVILIMSAIGGSMMPRFIMPRIMDQMALLTFNGWALDGFLKVFWYDDPRASIPESLIALWPQALALLLMAVVFFALARHFARRWEAI